MTALEIPTPAPLDPNRSWPHWTTPEWLLERVRTLGPITLDPCSNSASTVGARTEWHGPDAGGHDGMLDDWHPHHRGGLVYCNPPYSRGLVDKWARQCAIEGECYGVEIVALLPNATDTEWAQRYVFDTADAVLFVARRIRFDNPPPDKQGAQSPKGGNLLAYWGDRRLQFAQAFAGLGHVMRRLRVVQP